MQAGGWGKMRELIFLEAFYTASLEHFNMTSWIIEGRYDFSIPEAQWLSDLAGIDSDLEAVIRLCRRYMAEAKKLSEIPETGHGVWWEDVQSCGDIFFAAVVRYGRTLNSGSRGGIPIDWIEALPKEMQEAHQYHKTLRDKFVAHSVNCLEDNQVFVMLSPQWTSPGFVDTC